MAEKRRVFTDEQKKEAVELSAAIGRTAASRQLGISVNTIRNWQYFWISDGSGESQDGQVGEFTDLSSDAVIKAKELSDKLGGIGAARKAIDILEKLGV